MDKQMSIDPNGLLRDDMSTGAEYNKTVNTTQEFVQTINE